MKKLVQMVLLISSTTLFAQQISIPRIDLMPDFPQPYDMRNWKSVAQRYDSLVYNETATGQFLPLIEITEQTINYPDHASFGLQSYVGVDHPWAGEAINVLPSVIGASLCGIDKSQQFGRNWVIMCEEFFNKKSGEGVYLNNPTGASGHDWWYETMPNVFFYQLYELYPNTGDFEAQFISLAQRWFESVQTMGGSATPWATPHMNYRAWNLMQMEPLSEGVSEPEAAGALAWILYSAYRQTGNRDWRMAAEWCLEFLNSLTSNPSYELQLAYGTYTAARMNAELGTTYDVEKMMNWCFDVGPLRNWGAVDRSWGGLDCAGLIGEQTEGQSAYAFAMNGFQQAGALLPILRYDDRYARALGKWMLNLANASRLFYSKYLPTDHQDSHSWTSQYDPESVIAYEALKEIEGGNAPFATGDAVRNGWAQTNLALYGSSHVGVLGALVDTTNVKGILQVDLLKTDFYRDQAFPSYLYYNPYTESKQVSIDLGRDSYDIYDCSSNQFLSSNQSGLVFLTIPALEARVIVLVPTGSIIEYHYNHTLSDGVVIDYFNGLAVENFAPRIKSLASIDSLVLVNTDHKIYCTAVDQESDNLKYRWSGEGENWVSDSVLLWTAPELSGYFDVICYVKDAGGLLDSMNLVMHVVDRLRSAPSIERLSATKRKLHPGTSTIVHCEAHDINHDVLEYHWSASVGNLEGEGATVSWVAPLLEGNSTISCKVINTDLLEAEASIDMMVRDSSVVQKGKLIAGFYFDGSGVDHSSNLNHGVPYAITWEADRNGAVGMAAGFNGTSSMIRVSNHDYLNFSDRISLLTWIKTKKIIADEQFIISHGSWQNRYKVSITDKHLRFTINGAAGIVDLDSKTEIQPNTWLHVALVYNGRDMELYLNGELNSFKPWSGKLNMTSYDLTIGQMLPENPAYNFSGSLDDLRIFDYGIDKQTIGKIMLGEHIDEIIPDDRNHFTVYPNPAKDFVRLMLPANALVPEEIWLCSAVGNLVWHVELADISVQNNQLTLAFGQLNPGIYFIRFKHKGSWYAEKLLIY